VPLPGFHDVGARLAALWRIVQADPRGRASATTEEIGAARAAAPLATVAAELDRAAAVRVAHNDAELDNILFRGAAAVCIVDLDTVMPGTWMWDVGDLLRTASATVEEDHVGSGAAIDPTLYDAVLTGYRQGVSDVRLTAAELEALEVAGAVVTFEQVVRFLTDWLAGDVYYRTQRPEQNLDRARTQFQLLASMPGVARW